MTLGIKNAPRARCISRGGKCVVKLLVRHVQHHVVVARGDVVRE